MPSATSYSPLRLSVILCVNRSNPWLLASLKSVLDQDDPDFEFLVAANACSDDLWDELLAITAGDSRVRLFRTSIGQLAFNLNLLADRAQGDYLVRMDADDICEPQRIRILRRELTCAPVDVLGSAVTLIDEHDAAIGRMDLPLTSDEITSAMATRTVFCHPSVAIRRAFLFDMRGYLGGFVSEDTDLWLRARRANATLRNLPEALLRYRIHPGQSMASRAGYAEVAAHWLRELLTDPSLFSLKGFAVALVKCVAAPLLPQAKRYLSKRTLRKNSHPSQ